LCVFSLWALIRHDRLRLGAPSREARAVVVGYTQGWSDGQPNYAARLRFDAEGATHDVTDQIYRSIRKPPEGTAVIVRYPEGRPDLARIPRPLMWLAVYGAILLMTGLLLARLLGWIGRG
jgi:hypothetical protein